MNIVHFHEQDKITKTIYEQKIHKDLKDKAISFSKGGFYSFSNLVLSTFDRTRN